MQFSYILLEPLARLTGPGELRRRLSLLKSCGYEGIELNLTEPHGLDVRQLQTWLEESGLVVPSFLTGEAYFEGLCLNSADAGIRRRTVERLVNYRGFASVKVYRQQAFDDAVRSSIQWLHNSSPTSVV